MIVGLTSGCWDLFHHSHLLYLERCKEQCDKLIVGVDGDAWVRKDKGPDRPIHDELHRLNLISSLQVVDAAFVVEGPATLTKISKEFRVSRVFKCEKFRNYPHVYGVHDADAKLVIVPDIPGMVSTTDIINHIRKK